jgi:hypothetical protein
MILGGHRTGGAGSDELVVHIIFWQHDDLTAHVEPSGSVKVLVVRCLVAVSPVHPRAKTTFFRIMSMWRFSMSLQVIASVMSMSFSFPKKQSVKIALLVD